MEIQISTFIFVLLSAVWYNCALPVKSSNFDMDGDYEIQNDNDNYGGNYEDTDDTVEENKMPEVPLQINTREEKFIRGIGDTVLLPCEITGSNYVQVWRKKNSHSKDVVLFQSEIKMAATPNMKLLSNGSLEISNLHIQDAGEYECTAMDTEQNSPKIQHTVLLNSPPHIELLVAKDNVTVLRSGQTLILTCRSSGFPKPTISWHKGPSRFDIQGEVLEISNVEHHNAGTYKCLADNKIGEPAFSYINIKIEFKPLVNIEKMVVSSENNSKTELECLVHSEPRAQVVWKKDGLNIVNSERAQLITKGNHHNLILNDIQDSDFGTYVCSATNSLGSTEKRIKLVAIPAIHDLDKDSNDGKITLKWKAQSKSNLSSHELLCKRQGEKEPIMVDLGDELEVSRVQDDVFEMRYTLKGLDPGEYEFKVRSQNQNGWSDYSKTLNVKVLAKHGHHKTHKKGHKHGKEKQVTPTSTLSTQPNVPVEHQENESRSGFIKESSTTAPETSGSPSITPTTLLISIALFTGFQVRLILIRI